MRITKRTVGDVVILDLEGRIFFGEYEVSGYESSLHSRVDALAADGWLKVVVNLAAITYCDSTLLGEMVRSFVSLKRRDGILRLLAPGKQVRDLLEQTKLITVLEVYEDEEAAIRSFA